MRMILLALGALVVLGGGAAGAYFYFVKPAEASTGAEIEKGHEEAKAEKHAKKGGGGHGAEAFYVELDPLILPIVDNDGVSQVVSLVIAIEVEDDATKKEFEAQIPRLKDAYIQEMYGVLSKHAALKGGVLQVTYLKERLNQISAKVLGDEKYFDVLLQVVQQREI